MSETENIQDETTNKVNAESNRHAEQQDDEAMMGADHHQNIDVLDEAEIVTGETAAEEAAVEQPEVEEPVYEFDTPPRKTQPLSDEKLKNILEAALMAVAKPMSMEHIMRLFEGDETPSVNRVKEAIKSLQQDCEGRGIELKEIASGYRYQSRQDYSEWLGRLWEEKPTKYSRAYLETLALIAYRQPVTRAEIEEVRGVSVSSNIIKTMLERDWIRVVGHRDVPGRPSLYATTRQFLDYFNMKSLDELPSLAEIKDLEDLNPELDLNDPELNTDINRSIESDADQQEQTDQEMDASLSSQQEAEYEAQSEHQDQLEYTVELDESDELSEVSEEYQTTEDYIEQSLADSSTESLISSIDSDSTNPVSTEQSFSELDSLESDANASMVEQSIEDLLTDEEHHPDDEENR